jgi:protein SCO1/2
MSKVARTVFLALLVATHGALAHTEGLFKQVDFEQRLGAVIPQDVRFVDDQGHAGALGSALGRAPVVLVLGYLDCPNLCATVLAGASEALVKSGLAAGQDYRALFVSIDPRDGPAKAAAKKAVYLPAGAAGAWTFLTGTRESIAALARSVGFRYVYDAEIDEYAHPAGFVVLAPDGRVSRYFFGVRYQPWELRLALSEAAGGRIGTLRDRLLLLCYHYDPQAGRYNFAIMNGLRAGSFLFLLAAGGWLWRKRREP